MASGTKCRFAYVCIVCARNHKSPDETCHLNLQYNHGLLQTKVLDSMKGRGNVLELAPEAQDGVGSVTSESAQPEGGADLSLDLMVLTKEHKSLNNFTQQILPFALISSLVWLISLSCQVRLMFRIMRLLSSLCRPAAMASAADAAQRLPSAQGRISCVECGSPLKISTHRAFSFMYGQQGHKNYDRHKT